MAASKRISCQLFITRAYSRGNPHVYPRRLVHATRKWDVARKLGFTPRSDSVTRWLADMTGLQRPSLIPVKRRNDPWVSGSSQEPVSRQVLEHRQVLWPIDSK